MILNLYKLLTQISNVCDKNHNIKWS